ncbi:BCCIP homolog, putative [Babesia ovata]|uniref:BCCIP homolog, putative n=1 Tax=Babesia ovata TaxID=189622 RepID=A0A2H6K9M5_9APIC|nr:BCCIP homolog, putative [Babesia ovata]GBE59697.1 BCCIP homolog, putative [Babesia ovata]
MANNKADSPERAAKKHKPERVDSDEDSDGPLEADFLFNDPAPEDSDGILAIIQGYLKKVPWEPPKDAMDSTYGIMASLIANQPNLGTLVKTGDDEDEQAFVMAVLSLLNLKMYKELETLQDAIIALTKQHGSQQDLEAVTKILGSERNQVGLLVNERMGNIPTQLIGSLHQCLYDDLNWSVENADDEEERKFYKFTHLISISRVFTDNAKDFQAKHMVYTKPEERFYCEEATVKFMWNTGESNKVDFYEDGDESKPSKTRVVPEAMMFICVPIGKFKNIVRKIAETFA